MSNLNVAELINNIVIPVAVVAVSAFLIPFLRAKAKASKTDQSKNFYNMVANILEVSTTTAKNAVVVAEAKAKANASGADKKAMAVAKVGTQLKSLGIDPQQTVLDLSSIVEAAYSAKKDELHANYPKKVGTTDSGLPQPLD